MGPSRGLPLDNSGPDAIIFFHFRGYKMFFVCETEIDEGGREVVVRDFCHLSSEEEAHKVAKEVQKANPGLKICVTELF